MCALCAIVRAVSIQVFRTAVREDSRTGVRCASNAVPLLDGDGVGRGGRHGELELAAVIGRLKELGGMAE